MEERIKKIEDYLFSKNYQKQTDIFEDVLQSLESGSGFGIGKRLHKDSCSLIEINSIKQGIRFSNMTSDQRDRILSPQPGLVVFNTTTNTLQSFDGFEWVTNPIELYTTTERDALIDTYEGRIIYNSSTLILNYWDGFEWVDIGTAQYTTTQRNALTPYTGQIIYNTTTDKLNVFTTAWEEIQSI